MTVSKDPDTYIDAYPAVLSKDTKLITGRVISRSRLLKFCKQALRIRRRQTEFGIIARRVKR